MSHLAFRWRNFRSIADSGWLEVAPITVILGANASGKTSLLAPLLLLKQTFEARDSTLALKTKGRLFNAGAYADLITHHETTRQLQLDISFAPERASNDQAAPELGKAPPARLGLAYRMSDDGTPRLHTYIVRDTHDREMVRRTRTAAGGYSVDAIGLDTNDDSAWSRAIRASAPDGFLFTPDEIFNALFKQITESRGKLQTEFSLPVGGAHQSYVGVLAHVNARVSALFENLAYLGPLRERPHRFYELGGEAPYSVGPAGAFAPEILYRSTDRNFQRTVDQWLRRFEFGDRLRRVKTALGVFSIVVRRSKSSPEVNIADTGFGLSQVLPLIVQGFLAVKDSVLVAEQPEIHLNPRLQALVGDLFAAVAKRGVRVLVETHSEHLLLRLRRLVAEGVLQQRDLAVYFVQREDATSSIRRIPILKDGSIASAAWPKGFFEDALADSMMLASAQLRTLKP